MASWEPAYIDSADRDEIGEKDNEWGNDLMTDLERRLEKLRHFNKRSETSSHENFGNITLKKNKVKDDTIELAANQIYDKIIKLFNERRKKIRYKGRCKHSGAYQKL